jgi:GNAT superfamily N-acetyltransferase
MNAVEQRVTVRRQVRPGDGKAIIDLHERVYVPEYGMNAAFVSGVADTVRAAADRGWPRGGGAWLIDGAGGRLAGSLALTREEESVGRVRWFVLEAELRGRGLGARMLAALLAEARARSMRRLELETFSALRAAAHLYLTAGFRLQWSRERADWGPGVTYQHYELTL